MRDVVGYEGLYLVSDEGRIWSNPKKHNHNGMWLTPGVTKHGYLYVNLFRDGHYKSLLVNRIVLEAFVESALDKEAHHIDFSRANNKLSNLEWVTHEANVALTWQHNAPNREGVNNGRHFLTEETVREILTVRKVRKLSYTTLASLFNLKKSHIASICSGRIWSHISV